MNHKALLKILEEAAESEEKYLWLDRNRLTDADVAALAQSPYMASLRGLKLGHNRITDAGATALAVSPYIAGLQYLWLDRNRLTDAGVTALAVSPYIAGLKHLDLSYNRITDAGMMALAQSPYMAVLKGLCTANNNFFEDDSYTAEDTREHLASLSADELRVLDPPSGFHALRVARLMALGVATDDDLLGLEPRLLPEHRAWWEDNLSSVSDANLDRALALCPHHPRLLDRKVLSLRLQQTREDQLFF